MKHAKRKIKSLPGFRGKTQQKALSSVELDEQPDEFFRICLLRDRMRESQRTPGKFEIRKPVTEGVQRSIAKNAAYDPTLRHERPTESLSPEHANERPKDLRKPQFKPYIFEALAVYNGGKEPELTHAGVNFEIKGGAGNMRDISGKQRNDGILPYGDEGNRKHIMPQTRLETPEFTLASVRGVYPNTPKEYWLEICLKSLGF